MRLYFVKRKSICAIACLEATAVVGVLSIAALWASAAFQYLDLVKNVRRASFEASSQLHQQPFHWTAAVQGYYLYFADSCKNRKTPFYDDFQKSLNTGIERLESSVRRSLGCSAGKCSWGYDIHLFAVLLNIDRETGELRGIRHDGCMNSKDSAGGDWKKSLQHRMRYAGNSSNSERSLNRSFRLLSQRFQGETGQVNEFALPAGMYGDRNAQEFSRPDRNDSTSLQFLRSSLAYFVYVVLRPPENSLVNLFLQPKKLFSRDVEGVAEGIELSFVAVPRNEF